MDSNIGLDLKDIEKKMGRKIPDSLVRSVTDGKTIMEANKEKLETLVVTEEESSFRNLLSKMRLLRKDMVHLRTIDVRLMQQLLSINDGIESVRWALEERGALLASRDSSLAGSLYSLSESQETSRRGSYCSLQDGASDASDSMSVGSYLDTLAEDLHASPTSPRRTARPL